MSSVQILKYEERHKIVWNNFLGDSKNGIFLFHRDYMDYHADRFTDFSLLFQDDKGRTIALLPATIKGDTLTSHGGLTFGGVITDAGMKTALMMEVFDAVKSYLKAGGVRRIIYKAMPHIYHRIPAEEDLYALHRCGAKLIRRDVSSTIYLREKLPFSKGRRWAIKQSGKFALSVERGHDYETFMKMEEDLLLAKYNVKPAHSADEMLKLAGRFPDNIKLFTACRGGRMLAGVVVYESYHVAHAQYISTTDEGKSAGALDVILDFLINSYYSEKTYFDFGISTENEGMRLNEGLMSNKEGFGARAVVHDFYELSLESD
jgi:hypothetical protein